MAITITTLVSGTFQALLTTELNSLANNATTAASAAYSAGAGYLMTEVELVATFPVAPAANTGCSVWFLGQPSGTYEDGSATVTPARPPDVVLSLRPVTTAQRVTRRCMIPPGTFKCLLLNDGSGQTMAASGNTLGIKPFTYQSA
jgi:hypothetical protein